jgi:CPA1 family monovalent cation:H+ antiporter
VKRKDPSPPWQWPFLLAFTGVRGIVSLAAALAIPFVTSAGQPFPHRDLILFLTFSVILITLVGQGLMLPWVTRQLGLSQAGRRERQTDRVEEHQARSEAVKAAMERLDRLAAERYVLPDVIEAIRAQHRDRLKHVPNPDNGDDIARKHRELHDELELVLITAERTRINELFRLGKLKDDARRRIERELDLREAHLFNSH